MKKETFFENFELLVDASNGVQKLRGLILTLAVKGKLVPQNPNDEPASVFLEKIYQKKEKLIIEKKINKNKPSLPVKEEDIPFSIPRGWKWVRFGEVTINRDSERIPLSKDERENHNKKYDYYGASGVIDKVEDYIFDKPLLLIGEDGANLLNRSTPIAFIAKGKYWVNNHAHVLDSLSYDCLRYLEVFINSIDLSSYITGTAQPKMNQTKMNLIPVAVPPIEEQKRIVSKVDQLMALCDELEARQQEKQEQRIRLNDAALDKLLTAPTPEEFAKHWQRICDNFNLLYDAPETVGQLRQAILQLAVQGKLVGQNPNNIPASQLINDIIEERKKWYENECEMAINVGSKKPRKPKLTSIEFPEEFDLPKIPESWQFCLFEDIAASKDNAIKAGPFGSALTKNLYVPSGYKIYGQEQVIKGDASFGDYYIDDTKFSELKSCEVAPGDILISLVGTIGKVLILPNDCESGIINPRLVKLSLNVKINQRFIEIFLISPLAKDILNDVAHGGTMNILNLKILKNLPVPIPPIEEQAQIVAKVDQLMALCDELEAGLLQAQTDGGKLMEAVVHHVLAG